MNDSIKENQNPSTVPTESPRPAPEDGAMATKYLPRVPHSPADDDEIESYARGVVIGLMDRATPNVVGSLLSRIRRDAQMVVALERINEFACYTQENQDARDEMLLAIGNTARAALTWVGKY